MFTCVYLQSFVLAQLCCIKCPAVLHQVLHLTPISLTRMVRRWPYALCRYVQANEAFIKKEKELMKNVPGYKADEQLYSGGRWMPPAPRVGAWGGA